MIKNAKSLMDKSRNVAIKNNITTNEVLQNYMFERILERLSVSKYKNNFILKGGLLLSSIMGIDTRTTMDMDTCIKGINLTDEQLYEVLKEILSIDVNDGVKFEIRNSQPI
jgi:predicted nucleotidyltransferase component of viral defense system